MLELVEVEVGSSEGHHQVPQTDQGAVWIGKQTNNHVPIQNCHRCLVSVLRQQKGFFKSDELQS